MANIEREQNFDGIYVIRTSVTKEALSSQEVVASYKSLSSVERAFRSLKTVDLRVRPSHHRLSYARDRSTLAFGLHSLAACSLMSTRSKALSAASGSAAEV